jgi:hypothetical protein
MLLPVICSIDGNRCPLIYPIVDCTRHLHEPACRCDLRIPRPCGLVVREEYARCASSEFGLGACRGFCE